MIHVIDLHFQGITENIAAFLVETAEGPVLIETGPHSTLPYLREGVAAAGFSLSDVRHVFLSHIHLDHAGCAWHLAQHGADIYVHPSGSRHLMAPERLMESARQIYQDKMDALWGQMHPIPAARIVEVSHGQTFVVGGVSFRGWHTPGHAVHHIAWQVDDDVLFTGDVGGVCIHGSVVIPPCPPPDIHVGDWADSIALIQKLGVRTLYLTHFGAVPYAAAHFDELLARLHRWADWMKPHYEAGHSVADVTPLFQAMVQTDLVASGVAPDDLPKYEAANPSWMSVAGLMRYWKKTMTA